MVGIMKKVLLIFSILTIIGIAIGLMKPLDLIYNPEDVFVTNNFEDRPNFPMDENSSSLTEKQMAAIEIAKTNENVSRYIQEGYEITPVTLPLKEDFEKYGEDFKGVILLKNDDLVYVIVNTAENNVESISTYKIYDFKSKSVVIEQKGGYSEIKVTGFTKEDLNTVEEILLNDPKTAGLIKGKEYNLSIQDMVLINDQNLQNASHALVVLDLEKGPRYVILVDLTEKKVFKIGRHMGPYVGNHESKS